MSKPTPSTAPSSLVDERQPLLESQATNTYVDVQPDPEAAVAADESEVAQDTAKKVDFRSIVWYLVFAALGEIVVAGIVKGFVENGDIEVCVVIAKRPLLDRLSVHPPAILPEV